MGKVIIQDYTTKAPLEMIGAESGICYNSDTSDLIKNYNRGLECLRTQHGRTFEFPDVYLVLDGYSARVIREWYTSVGGLPTRLQASTRYIKYGEFNYITPPSIKKDEDALKKYNNLMEQISKTYKELEECGIPKEDIANILPLGMETKVVCKHNLRTLIDMSHQRMCTRAYWEYRQLFLDLCKALSEYSPQWKIIVDEFFVPKCEYLHYCPEKHSCGRVKNN